MARGDQQNDGGNRWYELFSRGARDWLRHDEKVRRAARDTLPEVIAAPDILSRPDNRSVQVPVRFLEHHRFKLANAAESTAAGQGSGKPGDIVRRPGAVDGETPGQGGEAQGSYRFSLQLDVDDILDWLWEELGLPNLKPRSGAGAQEPDLVREGWSRKGVRSRLDRRRTLRESLKRRAVPGQEALPFSNEDLRFRQLRHRQLTSNDAVVVFLLDASSSMDQHCRRLAKTFFFWALHGLRRRYRSIQTVFVAHTVQAWEFDESEFFQVQGQGGTKVSGALKLALQILGSRYVAERYNSYLYYASDGENFSEDRGAALAALRKLCNRLNFFGYVEVSHRTQHRLQTETGHMLLQLREELESTASYSLSREEDVWPAIRSMFADQVREDE